MSLGLVMFWKAVVLSLWAVFAESWLAYRKRRAERGLDLRLDRRTGTYRVHDWAEKLERFARGTRTFLLAIVFLWWCVAAYMLYTGDTRLLEAVFY